MISKVKFGIYYNTSELEIVYCFNFLIVHTNCMHCTVIVLLVTNVHSLIFLEAPLEKIRVVPLGSCVRTIPELGCNTRLVLSGMVDLVIICIH